MALTKAKNAYGQELEYAPTTYTQTYNPNAQWGQYQKGYDPNQVYGNYNNAMQNMAQGAYGRAMAMTNPMYYSQYAQKPWQMGGDIRQMVANQMGGARNLTNQYAQRMANASVASSRGGYGVAGGMPNATSFAYEGIKNIANQYPSMYQGALNNIGSWQDRNIGLYRDALGSINGLAGNYASNWGQGVSGLSNALAGQEAGLNNYNVARARDINAALGAQEAARNAADAANAAALNKWQQDIDTRQNQWYQQQQARTQAAANTIPAAQAAASRQRLAWTPYGAATPSNQEYWGTLQNQLLPYGSRQNWGGTAINMG